MLRIDSKYSELEARILDLALVLHAEHGGGNNSTFTTHVGHVLRHRRLFRDRGGAGFPQGAAKHGGANIKVVRMFEDMKAEGRRLEG